MLNRDYKKPSRETFEKPNKATLIERDFEHWLELLQKAVFDWESPAICDSPDPAVSGSDQRNCLAVRIPSPERDGGEVQKSNNQASTSAVDQDFDQWLEWLQKEVFNGESPAFLRDGESIINRAI